MDYCIQIPDKYLRQVVVGSLLLLSAYRLGYSAEHRLPETGDSLSLYLPNVVVTAIESKGPGSVSLLPASAIGHIQPFSAADLMQLLPGGLTGNPGFDHEQYFAIREVTLANGLNKTSAAQAERTQIVLDGSPLHSNAWIDSPFNGADTRFLSMNEVEQAEVVRGIPSARYGNLTGGVLKLKTRSGEMPLTFGIRYNPKLKQYTAGKGFAISPLGHTLNLLADYTAQGDFHTGGFRLANTYRWQPGGHPLTARFDYTARFGASGYDISEEDHGKSRLQSHRLTLNGEWQPGRRLLRNLSLRVDLSATKTELDKYYVPYSKQAYTGSTVTGESVATVLPSRYLCREENMGLPLYIDIELHGSSQYLLPQSGGQIELSAGLSWRSEGNRGKGLQFDASQPSGDAVRPRSYREIPFMHSGAVFAEALFRWPRITIQAGMRGQAMGSKRYPEMGNEGYLEMGNEGHRWMGSAEPRLNLAWTAFSSGDRQLQLKAGAGLMGYMPDIGSLHPSPVYDDRTAFYYNDTRGGHSLAVIYTHAPGNGGNPDLHPVINRKLEGGLMLETPAVRLDMTGFYEHETGGFAGTTDYIPYTYREYEYQYATGLTPEYRDGQVWVNGLPVPYETRIRFTPVSSTVNTQVTNKHGLEMTADFGTFRPLLTSLAVDAQWLCIYRKYNQLTGHTDAMTVDGNAYPYVGFYDKAFGSTGNENKVEQLSSNFRFITRIPRIGLVTSLTLQMVWTYRARQYYNGGNETEVWPLYWCGTDGIRHPFTEADRQNPDFALLLDSSDPDSFLQNAYKPYGLLNLRVSKAFGRYVTLSFFANNLGDMRPVRKQASTGSNRRQNPSPFFSLEMQIKL